jgi:hypothetical protein
MKPARAARQPDSPARRQKETMPTRRWLRAPLLTLVAVLGTWMLAGDLAASVELPARLSSAEFWRLSESFSEVGGYFTSDNLVSNEDTFQHVIPELQKLTPPGGVYLGVGPDQNFTYIAALKPRMVFITDIRRENLIQHLMYKALFEQSPDRVTFLSRLFSRPRPDGIGEMSSAVQLFTAFADVRPSQELYKETLAAILATLKEQHRLPLTDDDAAYLEYVFGSFYVQGPYLQYSSRSTRRYPTFGQLQMATDQNGFNHSYTSSEASYGYVRTMQRNNLIVPVVGNFAGEKALRAVGNYVRQRGAQVTTFYTSNVEQYLFQDRIWFDFAANVKTLPLHPASQFIRSCFNQCASLYPSRSVTLLDAIPALMRDVTDGKIGTYWSVLNHR